MKPLALVPVAVLFAGTAAFAASTSHPSSSAKPGVSTPAASASPDGGNSAAAHNCPKGPHGVHGKCVSAAAHSMAAARGKGSDDNETESPEASPNAAHPTAPAHPTEPPHPTPAATSSAAATPTPSVTGSSSTT